MRTAQRGLQSNPVDIDEPSHQGLVELARCRYDLSLHLLACCLLHDESVCCQVLAGADTGAPGLALTCRASNASPLVITAHRMRAHLLASATAAFCQPTRSLSAAAHCEIGSLRLCAVITADFAPWISRLRK